MDDRFLPWNFLALPPEQSERSTARFIVVPVPYDGTTSYKAGAREGPRAIIEASRQMEEFDRELGAEPSRLGIHTLPELAPHVGDPGAMVQRVAGVVREVAASDQIVVTLGGEHTITVGAVRGLLALYPDLSVLILDAHGDLRVQYMGSRYSHACTTRRLHEMCPVALAGTRSLSSEEADFIREQDVPVFAWTADSRGADAASYLLPHLSEHVYISVDLDALDPGIMPAVGTPEPGGMGWHDTLALLAGVAAQRRIVGFDLMELAPSEGPSACAFTAARLAYKLMGYAG
jgi:agmatinase